jgi:hypothetical protein
MPDVSALDGTNGVESRAAEARRIRFGRSLPHRTEYPTKVAAQSRRNGAARGGIVSPGVRWRDRSGGFFRPLEEYLHTYASSGSTSAGLRLSHGQRTTSGNRHGRIAGHRSGFGRGLPQTRIPRCCHIAIDCTFQRRARVGNRWRHPGPRNGGKGRRGGERDRFGRVCTARLVRLAGAPSGRERRSSRRS